MYVILFFPLIYDLVEEVTSHGIVVLQCVHQCLPAMLMQGSYGGLDLFGCTGLFLADLL